MTIDPITVDTLDSQPCAVRTHKRAGSRAGDASRRYVHAVRDVERENARLRKREERGAWR
jgi:hypothetical protein